MKEKKKAQEEFKELEVQCRLNYANTLSKNGDF